VGADAGAGAGLFGQPALGAASVASAAASGLRLHLRVVWLPAIAFSAQLLLEVSPESVGVFHLHGQAFE
jgi:hypothetical protein